MRPRHVTNRTDSGGKDEFFGQRVVWSKNVPSNIPPPKPPQGELEQIAALVFTTFGGAANEGVAHFVAEMKRREQAAYQAGLSAALGVLPEKHEQKINSPDDPDYDEKKARFYRDGGRNFALDEARQNIESLREAKND